MSEKEKLGSKRTRTPGSFPGGEEQWGPRDLIPSTLLLAIASIIALTNASTLEQLPNVLYLVVQAASGNPEAALEAHAQTSVFASLSVLTTWAVCLIATIQRMRARKLSFWVPLISILISALIPVAYISYALLTSIPLDSFTNPEIIDRIFGAIRGLGG